MVRLGGLFSYSSMGKRVGYLLPTGEWVGHWLLPTGGVGFCSSLWGSGFMVTPLRGRWLLVMFFPLGKLAYGYSSSGEMLIGYVLPAGEVGLMVIPCWGRGWVAWLFPVGGEGGLHGTKYSFVSIISVCIVVCDFL